MDYLIEINKCSNRDELKDLETKLGGDLWDSRGNFKTVRNKALKWANEQPVQEQPNAPENATEDALTGFLACSITDELHFPDVVSLNEYFKQPVEWLADTSLTINGYVIKEVS